LADEQLPIRYRLLPFRGNLQQINDARAKREKPPGARSPRTGVDERMNQERDVSYPNVRCGGRAPRPIVGSRYARLPGGRAAAASAPGIASVESHLIVTP
jgi:hypothetical protein